MVDLHAFIDGELDTRRRDEVAEKINADPHLARRVAEFRAGKAMLTRIYGPLIDRPVPAEWIARVHQHAREERRARFWRVAGVVAAAVILVVAVVFVYLETRPPVGGDVVQAALEARTAAVAAENVIEIGGHENLARYDAVLSEAVSVRVKVPELKRLGYRLTKIRFYPGSGDRGAAELLYRNQEGRLFTLYLRRSGGTARFDQFAHDGLRVCVWQDEVLSMVMAGNVSTAVMQRLASLTYTGLTLGNS